MEPKDRSIVNVLDLETPRWLVVRRAPPPPKTGHKYKSMTTVEMDDYAEVVHDRFAGATETSDARGVNVTAVAVDHLHRSSGDEGSTASFDSRTAQDERDVAAPAAAASGSNDETELRPQDERIVATAAEHFDATVQRDERDVAAPAAAVVQSFDASAQDERYYAATSHFVHNKTPAYTKTSAIGNFILASSAATFVCTNPADFEVVLGDSNDSARGGASTSSSNPTRSAAEARQRTCSLWTRSKELITGCFANAGKRMCF